MELKLLLQQQTFAANGNSAHCNLAGPYNQIIMLIRERIITKLTFAKQSVGT